jgi:hypothetical protein
MIIEGVVGPQSKGDGSVSQPRLGRLAELLTSESVGKYYELARRGQSYLAAMQAGAGLGTALTNTTVTIALYNPPGSGVYGAILQCTVAAAGVPETTTATYQNVVYAVQVQNAFPTSPTNAIVIPSAVGGNLAAAQGSNLLKAYTAATFSTPATAPVVARVHPFGVANFTTNAVAGGTGAVDYVDGALVIPSGTYCVIQGIATTTQTSGLISVAWAEIPA